MGIQWDSYDSFAYLKIGNVGETNHEIFRNKIDRFGVTIHAYCIGNSPFRNGFRKE